MVVTRAQVTSSGSREARGIARRKPGSLRELSIKPATLQKYKLAVGYFYLWLVEACLETPAELSGVDPLLAQFFEHLWESGQSVGTAGTTLSGLQWLVPALRRRLPEGWRLLTVWQRNELPTRSMPADRFLAEALAGWCSHHGDLGAAAAFLLQFDQLLRPAEAAKTLLSACTVLHNGTAVMVELGWTKGAHRKKVVEEVTTTWLPLVGLLRHLLQTRGPQECLVPGGTRRLAHYFHKVMSFTGLAGKGYTPYSLRRGGATECWLRTGDLRLTQQMGRWADSRTARLYVDSAALQLRGTARSAESAAAIKTLRRHGAFSA